jgi:hypothetical protein
MLGAYLFGLPNILQAGLEPVAAVTTAWQWQPTFFLSVMWHGEAF